MDNTQFYSEESMIPGNKSLKTWQLEERSCLVCGTRYFPKVSNQKYCTTDCTAIANTKPKIWVPEARSCVICRAEFVQKAANQKYCGEECQKLRNIYLRKEIGKRNCQRCGTSFDANTSNHKFCSNKCQRKGYAELNTEAECKRCGAIFLRATGSTAHYCSVECQQKVSVRSNFTNFSDLMCFSEEDFVEWFRRNFTLFGIKRLVKLDRFFPDCRAELFDGRWIEIELECYANNFKYHGHGTCDLVISFAKSPGQTEVNGIPVIAVFDVVDWRANGDFDYDRRVLTPFFQAHADLGFQEVSRLLKPISQER